MLETKTGPSGNITLTTGMTNCDVLVDVVFVPHGMRLVTKAEKHTYLPSKDVRIMSLGGWDPWDEHTDEPQFIPSDHYCVPQGYEWPEDKEPPLECELNGTKLVAHNMEELMNKIKETLV